MIDFVLRKMETDENLRVFYAEKYQFIMVDEYQDTNNAQNSIVDYILSVSDDKNILVV
jgi:DNA helicase-2/ATP-dependent DNA helicase PcrA